MITGSLGEQLVAALIRGGDAAEMFRLRDAERLLKAHELEAWQAVSAHVQRYGAMPTGEALAEMGLRLPEATEPAAYYRDELAKRHVRVGLAQAVRDVNENLAADPMAALDRFRSAVLDLSRAAGRAGDVIDLRDAVDLVVTAYKARLTGSRVGIWTGWPTLDNLIGEGGLPGGEMVSMVARPQMGKTAFLVWMAIHGWRVQQRPILFASMEMSPEQIANRAAAIFTGTPLSEILHQRGRGLTSFRAFKKKVEGMRDVPVPMHVLNGQLAATVGDLETFVRQLRPAALYVDGAYLLAHPDRRLQGHEKVRANCDLLKRLAMEADIPVVCSWQFNREATKKKGKGHSGTPTLADIAGSDAIGTHSAIVLALLEEDGDPAALRSRTIEIMKGRQGESGRFEVRWDWNSMDFAEVKEGEGSAREYEV